MGFEVRRRRTSSIPPRDSRRRIPCIALGDAGRRHADAGLLGAVKSDTPPAPGCGAVDVSVTGMEGRYQSARLRARALSACATSRRALGSCRRSTPLREVVVGACSPAGRELIDPLHESRIERQP
jgi:hypothetical protein